MWLPCMGRALVPAEATAASSGKEEDKATSETVMVCGRRSWGCHLYSGSVVGANPCLLGQVGT